MNERIRQILSDHARLNVDASARGDADALYRQLARMGFYDADDPEVTADAVLEHWRDVTAWYAEDRDFALDRRTAGRILIEYGDPRSRHWELMKRGSTPPDAMLGFRMQGLTLGVIGQLGATANWHRIAREWLFGDPPSTALGRAEAGYFGHGDRAAA